eukprot:CAMPEP_0206507820 /NCGR_PEP_ID=MMETSP0324_2-20121206/57826_1 /ASSEMBLY_ACC=CAM_ASM_000836 /TAXON_ID=2866 /ORGANISM="Crypthecodinium cohnii, Strain Seligo" /LENGTH=426 /DNA_ID=CAMNT_0053998289 /DNA_START=75 /DNA_END=1355 /DNA_ORIENTATION=-
MEYSHIDAAQDRISRDMSLEEGESPLNEQGSLRSVSVSRHEPLDMRRSLHKIALGGGVGVACVGLVFVALSYMPSHTLQSQVDGTIELNKKHDEKEVEVDVAFQSQCISNGISCDWTREWSCPGQPMGSKGLGLTHDYPWQCCCGKGALWKGPAQATYSQVAPKSDKKQDEEDLPKLYCYSVIRADGYERPLMKAQLDRGVGIFACDEFDLYSSPDSFTLGNMPSWKGGAPVVTNVFQNAKVGISKDNTAGNTELFLNVWNAVNGMGKWRQADFIMKVDPDAVLLPDRLKYHLQPYAKWGATYVKNCDKVPTDPDFPMMFGALEIFSREALDKYYSNVEHCRALPWQTWGEDFFMTKCLDSLQVYGLGDFGILGDNLCLGAGCGDGIKAAYHPFKTIGDWISCWTLANNTKMKPVQYISKPKQIKK